MAQRKNKDTPGAIVHMVGLACTKEMKDALPKLENGRLNQAWLRDAIQRALDENATGELAKGEG